MPTSPEGNANPRQTLPLTNSNPPSFLLHDPQLPRGTETSRDVETRLLIRGKTDAVFLQQSPCSPGAFEMIALLMRDG
jgi:hypothetical protein